MDMNGQCPIRRTCSVARANNTASQDSIQYSEGRADVKGAVEIEYEVVSSFGLDMLPGKGCNGSVICAISPLRGTGCTYLGCTK